ncbi:MAG: DUF2062 domain-containing protein [Leptospiraceae bacterium]|nr:DUF2062 domain-containing protein [Leptospiraceae bacterium]
MWTKFKSYLDHQLIRPFRESKSPINEVALGAFIGMLWAMTPLVGIQMALTTICWFLLRPFRIRFSIPIAFAMVWISNPVTMGPLYYIFYLAGYWFFTVIGQNIDLVSYSSFAGRLQESLAMGWLDGTIDFVYYIVRELGWPMLIGGFVIAVPLAFISYFLTLKLLTRYRTRKAAKEGLSLAEWEHLHVKSRDPGEEAERQRELHPDEFDESVRPPAASTDMDLNALRSRRLGAQVAAGPRTDNYNAKENKNQKVTKQSA